MPSGTKFRRKFPVGNFKGNSMGKRYFPWGILMGFFFLFLGSVCRKDIGTLVGWRSFGITRGQTTIIYKWHPYIFYLSGLSQAVLVSKGTLKRFLWTLQARKKSIFSYSRGAMPCLVFFEYTKTKQKHRDKLQIKW